MPGCVVLLLRGYAPVEPLPLFGEATKPNKTDSKESHSVFLKWWAGLYLVNWTPKETPPIAGDLYLKNPPSTPLPCFGWLQRPRLREAWAGASAAAATEGVGRDAPGGDRPQNSPAQPVWLRGVGVGWVGWGGWGGLGVGWGRVGAWVGAWVGGGLGRGLGGVGCGWVGGSLIHSHFFADPEKRHTFTVVAHGILDTVSVTNQIPSDKVVMHVAWNGP